ncbi:integrase core domain-containing protein [Dyadobacter fermentans]|uniref:integrase core domain-containing protein n=1 Tax=Dyadobacter fermentans TaxID=94254 RepID=UPI001E63B401|nr:integrase core domain-containing protein [Dyadobacter fermentans]
MPTARCSGTIEPLHFKLRGFLSFSAASTSIERAILAYNNLRPHASIGYLTPNQAHRHSRPLPPKWYPYKKLRFGNIQYGAHFQQTG